MFRHLGQLSLVMALTVLLACQPVDKHVLKLGANDWLGYQPFFTAQSLGFWNKSEISVVELGSATEVLRAFYNGSVDVAALTLDETISALEYGKPLKVVMVIDFSFGGDTLIAKREIETLADLKGKKVAVENTALGAVILDAVLTKGDLGLDEIHVLPATYDEHERVLTSGEADAVITFEPVKSKLLASGYRELFNTREIPGTIMDVLAVNETALKKYPDRIEKVISGYFKARGLILDTDYEAISSIAKRTDLGRDAVILGYGQIKLPDIKENIKLMAQCKTGFEGAADKLMDIMIARKVIEAPVSFQDVCRDNFIREVAL